MRPLHNAVVSGHPEIVALLIARGAKINSTDNQGRTPLISFAAIAGSNMDIPKMLLAAGADPAAEESLDHLSALDFAAVSSETDLAELLLSAGIDVNRRDSGAWGGTAIMHAIYHNRLEFVRLLIARGADVNLSDMQGKSTLSFATGKPEMQKLLIEAGAK